MRYDAPSLMGTSPAKKEAGKKHLLDIIQITRRGRGYLPFPGKDDIEIETTDLSGALNGDTVEVELTKLFPRPKGKVVQVLSRAKTEFVGTLQRTEDGWCAIPSDPRVYRPIQIAHVSKEITEGTKVLVTLLSFTGVRDPQGEITQVIGTQGEHRTEMNAIILEHGFSIVFPRAVQEEARRIEAEYEQTIQQEAPQRHDYRAVPTFTIDPVDAKDFDDALSVQKLGNGEYEIGIHIADVSFFVQPKSALDEEAERRGTSVYLVDSTIPMLPPELSNNVCSLKADEDRLTFSTIVRMNDKGAVLERRFEKTIIRSQKRFTYEEAQQVLDTKEGVFVEELGVLERLSRILKKQRAQEGAIDFGSNEVRFTLDTDGTPIAITRAEHVETHSLIEEFMLLANREVAAHVSNLAKKVPEKNYIFLYRIHDTPKEDKVEELATFVRAIGYEFGNEKKKYSARDIAKLLKEIEGTPEENLIRTATLRSMAKAIYSTKNIGHFGLAFTYYTHFTSPIRRYPDMLVHRILASHITNTPMTRSEFGHFEKLCIAASEQEAKAVNAERESIKYKQVEYLSKHIGDTFTGTITGVAEWGIYVEEKESGAEGLVRIHTIGKEFFNYLPKEYAIVGATSKKRYVLGDQVEVKLTNADLANRTLDFVLV